MKFDLQRQGNAAVVVAGGRLTSSHATRLHQELLKAFDGVDRVDLFLHDVQQADLTFVQLLCAAHRTGAARGVVFTIGGLDDGNPIRGLIHEAGAEAGAGCPEGCLWGKTFAAEKSNDVSEPGRRREP